MRLIDADTTKVSITRYFETHIRNLKANHSLIGNILKAQIKEVCTDVCFGIDAQQTVDAVPVVRCRDCKYLEVINGKTVYALCGKGYRIFESFETDTRTWFCADGERINE